MALVMSMGITAAFAADPVEGSKFTYTGTDATENGNISLANATKDTTYTLYKIFDATYSGTDNVSYTIKAGALKTAIEANGADYFTFGTTPDANGNYSVTRAGTTDSAGKFTPTKGDADLLSYIKTLASNFAEIGAIKSTVNGKIEWDKIPYGYYYISPDKPVADAAVTIDSNTPTVNVIDKNQTVSFEKNIIEDNQKVKVNEVGLKEDVAFQIETKATNYVGTEKVFKYVIDDSLEAGMTYKAAPTVKVDGTEVTPASIKYFKTDGTETTTLSEAQKFEIVVNWTADGTKAAAHNYPANATILVEYNAFLDPTKADQIIVGGSNDGNTNTAQVKYFKGPEDDTPDETTPSGVLPEQKTDTFTTELTILKTDQDSKALQGAEFTLTGPTGTVVITKGDSFTKDAAGEYWLLNDGTYTTQDPNGTIDGNPVDKTKYASETDKYTKTTSTVVKGAGQTDTDIKVEVGTDGKATFTGLGAGTYKLVESKVPAGYNKIADIDFTISATVSDDSTSQTGKKITFATNNSSIRVESDNTLDITVINQKGTELPSTGGIGTTIFYVVGSILVVAAGVLLITKKRMSREG